MTGAVGFVLALVALMLLVPAIVFFLQTMFARRAAASAVVAQPPVAPRPRIAVLVPAHDEAAGIAGSLATVVPQLAAGDRVLIVARQLQRRHRAGRRRRRR